MWLPKDERKTLSFYYHKTDAGARSINYSSDKPTDLINYLSNETKSAKCHQITSQTIKQINRRLGSSGLIKIEDIDAREVEIELTPEGLQLGQKFNSRIGTIGTWCTEYVWFFVVLGVIIGTITLLVTILKG